MICLGGGEVWAAFGDDESVASAGARFDVRYKVEALLEQILQTGLELVAGERDAVFRLGDDVVEVGFAWSAVNRLRPGGLQLPVFGSACGGAGLTVATSNVGCGVCAVATRIHGKKSAQSRRWWMR
jgi:hypothetical protein